MTPEKPSRELSVGEIISQTFNLYFSKFPQFFLPFLIAGIITGISNYAIYSYFPFPAQPSGMPPFEELIAWFFAFLATFIAITVLSILISVIIGAITAGIAVKYASDQIEKGSSNLGNSFNYAMPMFPSLFVAQLVTVILTVIGLVFFVIPGIIIAIMLSLIIPAIIIEQRGAFESLGRSRRLVNNRWLKTFGLLIIIVLIMGLTALIVGALVAPLTTVYPYIDQLISGIITAFVAPISPIAMTYLYYAMVARETPPPRPPPTL